MARKGEYGRTWRKAGRVVKDMEGWAEDGFWLIVPH